MREIKFRAWSPIKHKYIDYNYKLGYEYDETDYLQCVFEQYTGLKNAEGKEIYEGDLLLLEESWSELVDPVTWYKDMWLVHGGRLSEFLYCKIVGNIHESK